LRQSKHQGLLILFTISLLIFTNLIRSGILVDKSFLPRFLLLSFLLLITYLFRYHRPIHLRDQLFEWAFILFYLWNLLSCTWATSFSEAIFQSQFVFLNLSLFLVIFTFNEEKKQFESIFIKTQLIALLISFFLAFFKMSILEFYDPYKIISISANNNLYSGFLLLSIPLSLTGYSVYKGIWKYLSMTITVLSLFFIIIIQSRAGYLGLFLALLLSSLLMIFKYQGVFSKRNVITGIISFILLFSGVALFYSSLDITRQHYFMSKVPVWSYFKSYPDATAEIMKKNRNAAIANNTQLAAFDYSEDYYENANLRIIFWRKSLCMIKAHPLIGAGAGNWRIVVPSCKKPVNPDHTLKNYTYSQPHNEWISLFSELGIVGLILALLIYFIPPGISLRRMWFDSSKPPVSVVFYTSFILGFYLFSCFDFPLKRIEHNVLLFSLFAFLLNKSSLKPEEAVKENAKTTNVLIILLLLFTLFIGFARISGEFFTLKMFRNERQDDEKVIGYCRKAENPFYRITPNTLPVAWFEGVAYYRQGNVESAIPCFERALKSTPFEVRVLNDYGISLFNFKHTDEAKSVLLHAIDIDPFFDDAKFNLGAVYYLTGQPDSARYFIIRCRDCQKKQDFLEELYK
jgi:tetratricopeptide (TPR) repeat protein